MSELHGFEAAALIGDESIEGVPAILRPAVLAHNGAARAHIDRVWAAVADERLAFLKRAVDQIAERHEAHAVARDLRQRPGVAFPASYVRRVGSLFDYESHPFSVTKVSDGTCSTGLQSDG